MSITVEISPSQDNAFCALVDFIVDQAPSAGIDLSSWKVCVLTISDFDDTWSVSKTPCQKQVKGKRIDLSLDDMSFWYATLRECLSEFDDRFEIYMSDAVQINITVFDELGATISETIEVESK